MPQSALNVQFRYKHLSPTGSLGSVLDHGTQSSTIFNMCGSKSISIRFRIFLSLSLLHLVDLMSSAAIAARLILTEESWLSLGFELKGYCWSYSGFRRMAHECPGRHAAGPSAPQTVMEYP